LRAVRFQNPYIFTGLIQSYLTKINNKNFKSPGKPGLLVYNDGMKQEGDYISETIDIYNSIADAYALQSLQHGPNVQRTKFCSLVKKGGKILDAGCGGGRDSAYFVEKGFKVIGVDLSEKLLELARLAVPGAKFYAADLRRLSFEKNIFDGIWACASIIHIKHSDMAKVFSGFFQSLKPGGVLYIHAKKGEGEEYIEEPSIPGKKRFFSLFRERDLMKYCKNAGFTDIDVCEVASKNAYANGKTSRVWVDCFAKKA